MRASEIRDLPDEELLARLESQKEELFNLRFQSATGQLDNPMRVKQVRHDIARILTVLRDRGSEEELELQVAAADRQLLEERREAIASGELKGRSLAEMAVRTGVVVSDKMDKTVVVRISSSVRHSLYGKIVRRSTKLKAHDEDGAAQTGDVVRIMETRPLSKTKRWRVVEVIEKAK